MANIFSWLQWVNFYWCLKWYCKQCNSVTMSEVRSLRLTDVFISLVVQRGTIFHIFLTSFCMTNTLLFGTTVLLLQACKLHLHVFYKMILRHFVLCQHEWILRIAVSFQCVFFILDVAGHNPNSSDAIWCHETLPTLVHVMACWLTVSSHYLNQRWLIISEVLWPSAMGSFRGIAI